MVEEKPGIPQNICSSLVGKRQQDKTVESTVAWLQANSLSDLDKFPFTPLRMKPKAKRQPNS